MVVYISLAFDVKFAQLILDCGFDGADVAEKMVFPA